MVLGLGPRRTGRLRGRTRAEKEGAMIACVAGVAPSQGVGLVTMHDPWYPTPVHHDSQRAFSYLSSSPHTHMAHSQVPALLSRSHGTMLPLQVHTHRLPDRLAGGAEAAEKKKEIQRLPKVAMACAHHVAAAPCVCVCVYYHLLRHT